MTPASHNHRTTNVAASRHGTRNDGTHSDAATQDAATREYMQLIASIHETWDRLESESNVSVMPQRHMMDAIAAATRHGAQVHMPPTDLGPYSLSEFSLRSLVRRAVDSVEGARGLRTSFQHADASGGGAGAGSRGTGDRGAGDLGVGDLGVPETISCRISAHVTVDDLPQLAQHVRDAVRDACYENLGLSPTVNVHIEDLHDDD